MELPPTSLPAIWSFLLCTILLSSMDVSWSLGSASNVSYETDRLALINFKHLITDDPLQSLSSWNHTLHFCQWKGVTCGRQLPQRVTALNVSGQSLVGPISPYIANLTFLRIIDLADNSFHGMIPEEISQLFRLRHLNLSSNKFTGEIPANLTHCSELEILVLIRNQLTGRIPAELGSLLKLTSLLLSHNSLTGIIPPPLGNLSSLTVLVLSRNSLEGSIPEDLGRLVRLSTLTIGLNELSELYKATDGFSSANLIGGGSFGSVYKGNLDRDGIIIAVKVLNLQQQGATRSFMAECEALRNVRHRNLIKILTCCSSIDYKGNEFMALVFEYMPNGSLSKWLHRDGHDQLGRNLNFIQRLNIAIDVANALDYLHHHCQTPIIHRDLKPDNILLDDDMIAHVGDFGLARFLSDVRQTSSVGMKGSTGYIALGNCFIYFLLFYFLKYLL
ncbi:probable LRR receptor-like serine/threonine-protein kinase At3g47570 [Magnolia sinica]|uniref:probable LRR receptor-like serine/threonine-protein kinase At3g47570 n=1 Tax=Magnolia sinica TaxID=86752 RepID=UPI00265AA410|nr:probable LRR receptor-like serine/threonine-protein kinase At3g47570 [Magnolia sinica]